MECNGQSISAKVYPELFAVVGATVPDYQGMFLRGIGGNSDAIGVRQLDGIHSDMPFDLVMNAMSTPAYNYPHNDILVSLSADYGYYTSRLPNYRFLATHTGVESGINTFSYKHEYIPATSQTTIQARIQSASPETRPVNKAVRYLIRAVE